MTGKKTKYWIARDSEGLAAFDAPPKKYYINPYDEGDFLWMSTTNTSPIVLDPKLYPEITIDNSPQTRETKF